MVNVAASFVRILTDSCSIVAGSDRDSERSWRQCAVGGVQYLLYAERGRCCAR